MPPAQRLSDVYKTLSIEPLLEKEERDEFYRDQVNALRGGDKVVRLAARLNQSYDAIPFKCFLTGHPGVGKSTELARLGEKVGDRFQTLRIDAIRQLNAFHIQPFDLLLLAVVEVAEATGKPQKEGGAGVAPSDESLKPIWSWFADEKRRFEEEIDTGIKVEVGAGTPKTGLLGALLGVFAKIKGHAKYGATWKTEIIDYRLSRLDELVDSANAIFDECNRLMKEKRGLEWLVIGDSFERPAFSSVVENLFITYGPVLRDLRCHLILTLPVSVAFSRRRELPFDCEMILDTPVFGRDHKPFPPGRAALAEILRARVNTDLFEPRQRDRLIESSGGNLRDLFKMTGEAAMEALQAGRSKIAKSDVDRIIASMRTEYERSLGEDPIAAHPISYDKKAERLVAVYKRKAEVGIPDQTLYELLRQGAVQEFDDDGERWFGVHPLVLDILRRQEKLGKKRPRTPPRAKRVRPKKSRAKKKR